MPLLDNGTISLGRSAGSDEPDEYGMPQSRTEWTEPVRCMYLANRDDKRGQYTDGNFRKSIYDVHIASGDAPTDVRKMNRAKLTALDGTLLGEFPVQRVEKSLLTGRVVMSLGV